MGTSGGFGFPGSGTNVGDIHVIKTDDRLLVYVYIGGGSPALEQNWFLLGGRVAGDPNFGVWGGNQVGAQWFNSLTGIQKQFENVGTVSSQLQSNSVRGMYRDARDFSGTLVDVGCSFATWTNWTYHKEQQCGNVSKSGSDAIAGNSFAGVLASTALFSVLPASSHHVWVYAKAQSARPLRLIHNGTTLNSTPAFPTSSPEPGAYAWYDLGAVTVDSTLTFSLSSPANGANSNVTIWVRGMYVTNAGDTPTFTPTGIGGDITF